MFIDRIDLVLHFFHRGQNTPSRPLQDSSSQIRDAYINGILGAEQITLDIANNQIRGDVSQSLINFEERLASKADETYVDISDLYLSQIPDPAARSGLELQGAFTAFNFWDGEINKGQITIEATPFALQRSRRWQRQHEQLRRGTVVNWVNIPIACETAL